MQAWVAAGPATSGGREGGACEGRTALISISIHLLAGLGADAGQRARAAAEGAGAAAGAGCCWRDDRGVRKVIPGDLAVSGQREGSDAIDGGVGVGRSYSEGDLHTTPSDQPFQRRPNLFPNADDILVIDGARPSYSRAAYRLDETVESPGRAGEQGQEYPADPGRGQPVNLFSNVYKV